MFDDDLRDFPYLWMLVIGNIFLWGSVALAFLDWTFDMGFFRTMVFGLVLVSVANYKRENK